VKKGLITLYCSLFCFLLSAQDIIIPPELRWWIDEVQKANPSIAISDFKENGIEERPLSFDSFNFKTAFPVLMKWNYSGNRFSYEDMYVGMQRTKSGKYRISHDIDSGIGIFERNGKAICIDVFGPSKGINGVAWLRDDVLIACGIWIRNINREKAVIDLIIREYRIKNKGIKISEYIYKDAFDNDVRFGLRLNWQEQRNDYFE